MNEQNQASFYLRPEHPPQTKKNTYKTHTKLPLPATSSPKETPTERTEGTGLSDDEMFLGLEEVDLLHVVEAGLKRDGRPARAERRDLLWIVDVLWIVFAFCFFSKGF